MQHCAEQRPNALQKVTVELPCGQQYVFHSGGFLGGIKNNFLTDKKPKSTLTDSQKEQVLDRCAWLPAAVTEWQNKLVDQLPKPSKEQQLSWFLKFCVEHRPKRDDIIGTELTDGSIFDFNPERFFKNISENFVEGKKANTTIDKDQQRQLLETCKWLPAVVSQWEAKGATSFVLTKEQRLSYFLSACSQERPTSKLIVIIDTNDHGQYEFQVGAYWFTVMNNFVPNKKIHTKLSQAQMDTMLQKCTWIKDWILTKS